MLFATVIIVLVGLSTSDPLSRKEIAKPRADDEIYRLKTDVIPEQYTLKLTPNFDDKTFTGSVDILLKIEVATNDITLHHRNLTITKELITITTKDDPNTQISIRSAASSGTELQEFFKITTRTQLQKGTEYILHISEFHGKLTGLRGFYYAEYTDENNKLRKFATTHFEPTGARQAFPCFDEPRFKAQFKIYITRPKAYSESVSNMKLQQTWPISSNVVEDEFEISIRMSTYLVAFIVSEMKLTDAKPDNIVRTLAPPEDISQGRATYSVDEGDKIIKQLQNFLKVNYSINKMYQASIPDNYFTPGAMENWGLVTYRRSYLLVTKETTTAMQQSIDTIIAHEFAHQWFGNLATQEWWSYLWLSEGFATYFQYKAVDAIKPEWKLMEQFTVRVTQLAFGPDSLSTTRSMNHDAGSPVEISRLFDRIAYEKSGAVLRMIEAVLTLNVFGDGLQAYLNERGFNYATPEMLYKCLDSALDLSTEKLPNGLTVDSIMRTWDSQKGYPLVTVKRNYDGNQHTVEIVQNKFTSKESLEDNTLWTIPINYATRKQPDFKDLRATEWLTLKDKEITIAELNQADWIIFNKQEAYYYRVNYDANNWNLISDALKQNHSKIDVINRAQIIDDSFNIAKFEILDYSVPFSISLYLEKEVEYVPFVSFFNAITFLNGKISGTPTEKDFQQYVLSALKGVYNHLGFKPKNGDSHTDKLNRPLVINYLCNFKHEDCRNKALLEFISWKGGNSLPLDLEGPILCGAMRIADLEDWTYLYKEYSKMENSRFKSSALSALGCSEDTSILENLLHDTIPIYNKVNFQDAALAVIRGGSIGVQTTFDHVSKYFPYLLSIHKESVMTSVITEMGSKLTTEEQYSDLKKFAEQYKDLNEIFAGGLSKAKENIDWNKKRLQEISTWFISNKTNGSEAAVTVSIFLFVISSVLIIIF